MPLLVFICEHCKEEVSLFLRASQVGKPVTCPNCQKEIKNQGEKEADDAPSPAGSAPT